MQTNKNRKRIILIFFIFSMMFTALLFRVGWIQIVASDYYSRLALETQTKDVPLTAKRGIIYDTNMKELAISAASNIVYSQHSSLNQDTIDQAAVTIAGILEMDVEDVKSKLNNDKVSTVRIAKWVEKPQADQLRAARIQGILIAEAPKRHYPFGNFAAHILGSTTDDNEGLSGVELKYNEYLSGTNGRWIRSTDLNGLQLSYGAEKYFQAENGLNTVLTIDETIQHFTEKACRQALIDTKSKRIMCIVMEPKTGYILAMACVPDFDPNDPRIPMDSGEAARIAALPDSEKLEEWNKMWRNPLISDTYEPGSTFKLLTTAMALEEGMTSVNDHFHCNGHYTVAGVNLRCWRYYNPHGGQTLTDAVSNSCNPVFIQLGQRVGMAKFYDYLEEFGIMGKTGVDFPGEANPIIQGQSAIGPVELATMTYGQGIAVTPVQLLSAVCAIGNGGTLMQPRLVRALVDDNGNAVEEYQPKEVRQILSKKTSDDMLSVMEGVVKNGSGKTAGTPGYRIGGKTGTADKVINNRYGEAVMASFVGIAPIEDPRMAILFIADEPSGVHFGSQTAAPYAGKIMEETLRYLNIKPTSTVEKKKDAPAETVPMPDITGKSYEEASEMIENLGLLQKVMPEKEGVSFTVVDQYPKAGEAVLKGNTVYIYSE